MPVVFLKYRPDLISDEVMEKLVAKLPTIVSSALDVPDDENKRLTPDDIQIWPLPAGKFDVNVKALQLIIPLHHYSERVVNLDARAGTIVAGVHQVIGDIGQKPGWVWILPSPDTGFCRI